MISVIVPIYNSEKFLEKCLDSIQCQTYSDFEVILVDNGSGDNSKHICKRYLSDSRFKYHYCPNKGIVNACKTGIACSKGELLLILDSDDYIESNMFEIMVCKQSVSDSDIVVCGYYKIENECIILRKEYENRQYFGKELLEIQKSYFLFNEDGSRLFYGSKWNKLFKRSLIIKCLKFYTNSVQEDEDMCLVYPAFLFANKIVTVEECLYYYIQHSSSVTHNLQNKFVENQLEVIESLIAALHTSPICSMQIEQSIVFSRMLCLIQKARFFDHSEAVNYLHKLHEIEMFSTFNLSEYKTEFIAKASLAQAFLDRDYDRCLELIEQCLV